MSGVVLLCIIHSCMYDFEVRRTDSRVLTSRHKILQRNVVQ